MAGKDVKKLLGVIGIFYTFIRATVKPSEKQQEEADQVLSGRI